MRSLHRLARAQATGSRSCAGENSAIGTLDDIGISDWSWVPALAEPSGVDLTHGWLRRATEEVRDELEMVRAQMQDAVEKQQFGRAEMLKRLAATIAGRQLYGFLASRNVLPKYGFPVDVVELNLARTGDAAALNLELQRDLKLAIGEYAPGCAHHRREGDLGEPGRRGSSKPRAPQVPMDCLR